jgi:ribulose-5-phosphate 4-epimerase/fuculose-1-phosphate aldolase
MDSRSAQTREILLEELVAANHILSHLRVIDAYGHISARDPEHADRYWISRAMPAREVSRETLAEVTLEGAPVRETQAKLFFERVIHGEIYRARPDVNAVIHAHSPNLIPFCNSATLLRPMTAPAAFLGAGAPAFDSRDVDDEGDLNVVTPAQGRALAQALGDHALVLLRRHGVVVVGANLREMTRRAVVAEANAQQQLQASVLGPVQFLTEAEIEHRRKGSRDPDRAWNAWLQEARAARR